MDSDSGKIATLQRENAWLRTAIDRRYGQGTVKQLMERMPQYFDGLTQGREESRDTISKLRDTLEKYETPS